MFTNLFAKKKKKRNPEDGDFCYYPFMQILLTSDGKYRPCSKHQDYITHEGRVLTTQNASLKDAWNSDYMQSIRKDFIEGRQFAGCSECWRLQSMGLKSMRYDSFQYNISEEQVSHPIQPVRIELNSSNVCNLRCRICYPNASSKWIKEGKDLYGEREYIHKNLEGQNWLQVIEWAENLDEICFFGGEPLLSEDNLALMDYLIQSGNAKNISLLFNTNGTIFNDEIAQKLLQFKRVRMYFSIDDIEKRFEYQRSGAKWSEVENNIRKAYDLSRSDKGKNIIDFKICNTVSILNIYYFPEFFAYFSKNFPGLKIFWNLIFDPWRLSIQILPDEIKSIIKNRLQNYLEITFEMTSEETKTVDELVQYLEFKVEKPFSEFFRYINRHDVYRKESFPLIFPELWALIEKYKPEDIQMGAYDKNDALRIDIINNQSKYPKTAIVENYRKNFKTGSEWIETLGHISVNQCIYDSLVEISKAFEKQEDFQDKFQNVLQLLHQNIFLSKNFSQDILVSGTVKMYSSLMDIINEDWESKILHHYPIQEVTTS